MLTLTITLESNWHVGTGEGSPSTDAVLYRIADSPAIPASQLKDLVREHASAIAPTLGLDRSTVDRAFGTPGSVQGSFAWGSARSLDGQVESVVSRHHRRDRVSGVVPRDGLFDLEIARPCVLTAECDPRDGLAAELDELLLAMIAAATVRRVGARRNRGFGHCRIEPSWHGPVAMPTGTTTLDIASASEACAKWRDLGEPTIQMSTGERTP